MAEPSIGEIVGRPDPYLAKGEIGVPLDISSGLQGVTQAARDYSQNLLQRYALYQKGISDYAQNHQLDFAGVMSEDLPALKEKAANYFSKVANNPSMIHNIGNDPDWVDLQSSLQKSKNDRGYLETQEQFRRVHPDLYNQTNEDIIGQYRKTPLETRQPFNLDLPKTIDFTTLGKTTLGEGQAFSTQLTKPTDTEGKPIEGYFLEAKGKKYDLEQFKSKVDSLYNSDYKIDPYGHTINEYAKDHFELLSPSAKKYYEALGKQNIINGESKPIDAQEAWFQDQMLRQYRPFDITDTSLQEDKYAIDLMNAKANLGRVGIEQQKLDKDNRNDILGSDAIIGQLSSIINKGTPVTVTDFDNRGLGHNKDYLEVGDPAILNSFGKVDKEGNVTNVPDNAYFDKDNGQLNLIYYRHIADPETGKETQQIQKTKTGKRVVDRIIPMDEREWVNQTIKTHNPNKDIGTINSYVNSALNKAGGLYNLSQLYGGKQTTPAAPKATELPTKYKAKMADGRIITSNDGINWVDEKGNEVK